MITYETARRHEKNGRWEDALATWKELYKIVSEERKQYIKTQIDAVERIVLAISMGDRFRALVEPFQEMYEDGQMSGSEYHYELGKVYNQVFKK
jgi:hypothetical protein